MGEMRSMLTIIIRTVIIYVFLVIIMRLMGKRQLGELDVGELVITILLSEIATLPITESDKPMWTAIVPITILASLEILSSLLILKFPLIKKTLSSKPSVIISHGKIDLKTLKNVRVSVEELMSQIRQNGVYDITEVDYAILEENGKMSIIPKSRNRQPDREDFGLPDKDCGVMHIVISDGVINSHGLKILNKDRSWLESILKKHSLSSKDIFCLTCNDADEIYIIMKDGNSLSI